MVRLVTKSTAVATSSKPPWPAAVMSGKPLMGCETWPSRIRRSAPLRSVTSNEPSGSGSTPHGWFRPVASTSTLMSTCCVGMVSCAGAPETRAHKIAVETPMRVMVRCCLAGVIVCHVLPLLPSVLALSFGYGAQPRQEKALSLTCTRDGGKNPAKLTLHGPR